MTLRILADDIPKKRAAPPSEKPQKRRVLPRQPIKPTLLGPEPESEPKTKPKSVQKSVQRPVQKPTVQAQPEPSVEPVEEKSKKKTRTKKQPKEEPKKEPEQEQLVEEDLSAPDEDNWVWDDPAPTPTIDISSPAQAALSLSTAIDNLMSLAERVLQDVQKVSDDEIKAKPDKARNQFETLVGPMTEQIKQVRQVVDALVAQTENT